MVGSGCSTLRRDIMKLQIQSMTLELGNDYRALTQVRDALNGRIQEMLDAVPLASEEVMLVHQNRKIEAVKALRGRMEREGRDTDLKFCKDVIWAYAATYDRNVAVVNAKEEVLRDVETELKAARCVLDEIVGDVKFKHKLN
jgi:hypothetical protein